MTSDMVASRSDPFGQSQIQSRFSTPDYPGTKEKIGAACRHKCSVEQGAEGHFFALPADA